MLELKKIVKTYGDGANAVHALKGIDLVLPDHGVVSILGQSGCGKTTLLNIIGGLDFAMSGELIINNVSTRDFSTADWNGYRNHNVGFVFQNYYLIPHLNVLENVMIAMNLSGITPKQQRKKALEALEKVGLSDQIRKKPKQLSGGQAQRVAIARAIANKPDIILADEPTGALDSENSVQILSLLRELSAETLVVIVTHNNELADEYSDRIIRMKDGEIVDDKTFSTHESTFYAVMTSSRTSAPAPAPKTKDGKRKKPHMSLFAAFKTSLKNLYHKKGRTVLTSIAGCIGVVSIALILGLNAGFSAYAAKYQRDSLSKYPITVSKSESIFDDITQMVNNVSGNGGDYSLLDTSAIIDIFRSQNVDLEKYTDEEKVFIEELITGITLNIDEILRESDTKEFKKYVDENFDFSLATVKNDYNVTPNVYNVTENEGVVSSYYQISPLSERTAQDLEDLNSVLQLMGVRLSSHDIDNVKSALSAMSFWDSLVNDTNVLDAQYKVLAGSWPQDDPDNNVYEAVLVVDEYNRITDMSLYALGYISFGDLLSAFLAQSIKTLEKLMDTDIGLDLGERLNLEYDFDEFIGHEFRVLLDTDYYAMGENGLYVDRSDDETHMKNKLSSAATVRISGIVQLRENVDSGCINGDIGYSQGLVDCIIGGINSSDLVVNQKANYDAYKLATSTPEYEAYRTLLRSIMRGEKQPSALTEEEQALFVSQSLIHIESVIEGRNLSDEAAYETLLLDLGVKDVDSPESIKFYPFGIDEAKKTVAFIEAYNAEMQAKYDAGETEQNYSVKYVNKLDSIMSGLTTMIDTITYILIAVTCLALIVSLFMVAIIMYISVQDRTKEIGILRSMGARKTDIMNIFNAETVLLGLFSGLIGVGISYALTPFANRILEGYLHIGNLVTPVWWHSIVIIAASMVLTCLSGLFPAIIASKKDPVIALRSDG